MPPDTLTGMGRPKKSEPTVPFRVRESFAGRVRRVALHHKMDPADFLAEHFNTTLTALEQKMFEDMVKEFKGTKGKQ